MHEQVNSLRAVKVDFEARISQLKQQLEQQLELESDEIAKKNNMRDMKLIKSPIQPRCSKQSK